MTVSRAPVKPLFALKIGGSSRKCIEVLLVLHSLVTHTMEIFRDIFARVNFLGPF